LLAESSTYGRHSVRRSKQRRLISVSLCLFGGKLTTVTEPTDRSFHQSGDKSCSPRKQHCGKRYWHLAPVRCCRQVYRFSDNLRLVDRGHRSTWPAHMRDGVIKERRVHCGRKQRRQTYSAAILRLFGADRLAETADGVLGSRVGRQQRHAVEGNRGADVDDAAPIAGPHEFQCRPGAVHGA
jgi:hypothetical protein